MEQEMVIYVPPGRGNTCKHHGLGEYSVEYDYWECWCQLEDNELHGWFPVMHLDHCVFPAASADECCAAYEVMSLPLSEQG